MVSVVGLGYAGLPLAVAFAEAGFRVLGVDVDGERVARLNRGDSAVQDVSPQRLGALVQDGRFRATTDYGALAGADSTTICVPTPLGPGHLPDLSYIERAVDRLAPQLHREQLVVLESTTYPGTTGELVQPRLEAKGLRVGQDFYLGFAPERIDPGATSSPGHTLSTVPRLVAGATDRCRERVAALYETIVQRVVPVSSLKTAEMAKLVENAFRMVNIGFANEVALMCDRLGTDVWEVIDAAATKPYGFMPHYPGPGLGGHCIPVDPYYLVWKLRTLDFPARFIELAGEINRAMPAFVVGRVSDALERRGQTLRGARVLVLGVTYKRDVADARESPSIDVLSLLLERGARATYHDPYIQTLTLPDRSRASGAPYPPPGAAHAHNGAPSGAPPPGDALHSWEEQGLHLRSVDLIPALEGADCVVICTDHSAYD
ncbi:MAG TPA: nucleotide sugar dehydrogenase, partial [Chloroflexota bacterium]|nr:nucleotide sugar dehydrogenase [Chloroflexota bacterium]